MALQSSTSAAARRADSERKSNKTHQSSTSHASTQEIISSGIPTSMFSSRQRLSQHSSAGAEGPRGKPSSLSSRHLSGGQALKSHQL